VDAEIAASGCLPWAGAGCIHAGKDVGSINEPAARLPGRMLPAPLESVLGPDILAGRMAGNFPESALMAALSERIQVGKAFGSTRFSTIKSDLPFTGDAGRSIAFNDSSQAGICSCAFVPGLV
jgi:hypothetical protein